MDGGSEINDKLQIIYNMERKCKKCEISKSIDCFPESYDNGKTCKECRSKRRRYLYHNIPGKRERSVANNTKWRYIHLYGITFDEFKKKESEQNNKCAICNKMESIINNKTKMIQRLSVDHCHKTKIVRDLLCDQCNLILGILKDDISFLEKMISYLKRWDKETK